MKAQHSDSAWILGGVSSRGMVKRRAAGRIGRAAQATVEQLEGRLLLSSSSTAPQATTTWPSALVKRAAPTSAIRSAAFSRRTSRSSTSPAPWCAGWPVTTPST